jgi:putative MATE family efflux protein
MRTVNKNLTEGSLVKNIWHLAAPLMVSSALMDLFNIVDMIFVGKLGPAAIAAVSISGIIMGLIRMVAMGISTGTVAMVSRFVGADERSSAEEIMTQSLFLSFVSSIAVAVTGYLLAEPVLRLLGATEDILPDGTAYLTIMCFGGFTIFLTMTLSAALRGFGDAVTPMRAMGMASLLNVGLDPLLIFGLGPFPRLGVAGSAIATVIARAIGSAYLLWILLAGQGGIGFGWIRAGVKWDKMKRIIQIGFFSSLRMLSMNLSRIVLVRIVALFGTFAIAAYGVGMRLRLFVLMPGIGFADAASVLVGQNLGASKPERAAYSAWICIGFYAIFLVPIGFAFLVFPQTIIGIFNAHPEVLKLGSSFISIYALSLLFSDLAIVLGRAHDGAGDTVIPMVVTGVSLLGLGIPLAWWFSRIWGINGIWIAIAVSEAAQGVAMAVLFSFGRWKSKAL